MERKLEDEFLEKLILKGMTVDERYLASLMSTFNTDYFDNEWISKSFDYIIEHFKEYNKVPTKDTVINSFKKDEKEKIKEIFNEIESVDFDIAENYEFLFDETNQYLKEKAFKESIWEGVQLIENNKNPMEFKDIVEKALSKDLKIDLGESYFGNLKERLARVISQTDVRTPSFFPYFDEFISYGFPVYTLSVILSRIHGFKCVGENTLIQVKNKYTGEIKHTRIKDFLEENVNTPKNRKEKNMVSLERMIEKYGKEEGERRYYKWKDNVSKSSKNRNTLDFFIKKYGKEEGKRRHNQYKEKQKFSHSKKGYIKKYGKKEGLRKWEERMIQLKNTTSLEGFVCKYGEEECLNKWKERQEKWQNTLNNKSQEEKDVINEKKKQTLENMQKKYGKEDGRRRYIKMLKNRYEKSCPSSIPEKDLLRKLKENLKKNKIEKQKYINNKYIVDILIDNKICVEFFGDYWHCNPLIYESNYYHSIMKMKAEDKWKLDEERINFFKENGYHVIVIWEYDWNKNQEKIINDIKEEIKDVNERNI